MPSISSNGAVDSVGHVFVGDKVAATVKTNGVPVDRWPKGRARGRAPYAQNKQIATLLSWCIQFVKNGGRKRLATQSILDSGTWGSFSKVTNLRTQKAVNLGVDPERIGSMTCFCRGVVIDWAVSFPSYCYQIDIDTGLIAISGTGYYWDSNMSELNVLYGECAVETNPENLSEAEAWLSESGPLVFVGIGKKKIS
jgi:hypothetical protein